jgi:hypothetical protein
MQHSLRGLELLTGLRDRGNVNALRLCPSLLGCATPTAPILRRTAQGMGFDGERLRDIRRIDSFCCRIRDPTINLISPILKGADKRGRLCDARQIISF